MRKQLPTLALLASITTAEASSNHCDTFDQSITLKIEKATDVGGEKISRVIPNHSVDVRVALKDIDPQSLWLIHDSKGPGTEELLVAEVAHDGDRHVGLGTFELDLEGTKTGSGWTVPGDSVVICRGEISSPRIKEALKLVATK